MTKKYVLFILTLLMIFSYIPVNANSVDPYIMNKNEQDFMNVKFDDSFFTVKIKLSNGEIVGYSELSKTTKPMTDREWVQMIVDCAEAIYGMDSERYKLNKNKFITLFESGNFNHSDFMSFKNKSIQPRYEFHKEKDKFMTITFNHSEFSLAVRVDDGEITGYGPIPELKPMTDEQLTQMVIDCAELVYGKDSERYKLNKDKFTTLLKEGDMNCYD